MVVMAVLAVLVVGGGAWATFEMLATPDISTSPSTPADGARAQRKLFDLARPPRRSETVALTETEINALLAHHLVEARGVRLANLSARLVGGDRLVFHGRSALRSLLAEASLGGLADALPARWQARPVWIRFGARLRVDGEAGRQLRIDVDEFAVGRQWLPSPLVRLLLDPGSVGLLQWPLPDHVERVGIEPGQVVIRTVPPR
jgi:hypothetical protein